MLKNYFKIAFRNLFKNKIFSFINIFGLTVGLTSFILIGLYVFDELTFDRFHKNADNIYRIIEDKTTTEGRETKINGIAYQIGQQSKNELPGIREVVRLTSFGRTNVGNPENKNIFYEVFITGNEAFLSAFDFPLLYGDRKTALKEPHTAIITKTTAIKYFNTADVIDKTLKLDGDSTPYKITGVLKDFPSNSHISFNILFSEPGTSDGNYQKFIQSDWTSNYFTTYLLLNDKTDPRQIETKLDQLVAANTPADDMSKKNYILQPLKNIHFYSAGIEGEEGGNISHIYIFCLVAIFVLLIACINYMNLTTARFSNRSKEIAVRKVAGASRKNVTRQFLTEAFLITTISLALALAAGNIILPWFNSFTQKQLSLGFATDYRIWTGVFSIIIIVSLLAGAYPAFYQSALKPIQLFKNKINTTGAHLSVRKSLVIFQFAISIIMIVATMVVYMQIKYLSTKDMGFDKEQMLVIDINSRKIRRDAHTIKTEFAKLPQVKSVSVSTRVPGEWKVIPKIKVRSEKDITSGGNDFYFLGVDDQFLKTYQIDLLAGRNFNRSGVADSNSVLVNESAARLLGIRKPLQQKIEIPSAEFSGDIALLDEPYAPRVIGIVKDFNVESLRKPVAPMILGFQNNPVQDIDYFTVKLTTHSVSAVLKKMDLIMNNIDQDQLFEYHFLDKQWQLFYQQDKIRETIFLIIAILTIIIACLGLFGLVTFAAEQRVKEIGIRKVLGAKVSNIVTMLSKDFLMLVMVATVIAIPAAWWAMNHWLEGFAYRINIRWWVFAIADITALLIALITMSFQAIRAASANPVKSLKTE